MHIYIHIRDPNRDSCTWISRPKSMNLLPIYQLFIRSKNEIIVNYETDSPASYISVGLRTCSTVTLELSSTHHMRSISVHSPIHEIVPSCGNTTMSFILYWTMSADIMAEVCQKEFSIVSCAVQASLSPLLSVYGLAIQLSTIPPKWISIEFRTNWLTPVFSNHKVKFSILWFL